LAVNPDTNDGHIDVANEIAEEFAKKRISGEEWQILWVVIRHTWGWHKSWDKIALKQFFKETGIIKPRILRLQQKLITKNIITKKGNKNPYSWHINSHYDTWKMLPKKVIVTKKGNGVTKKGNGVTKKGNFQSLESTPDKTQRASKETITKETITKERSTMILSQIKNFLSEFPQDIKETINEYIELARLENKTKRITLQKHHRLLNELHLLWSTCNQDHILQEDFKIALRKTVNNEVPNINYVKKVMKGIMRRRVIKIRQGERDEHS